jgi:hypothetical protein
LAYSAFGLLLPLVHVPLRGMTAAGALTLLVVPTALFMLLQLWLAYALVRLRMGVGASLGAAVLSILVWLLLLWQHPHHRVPREAFSFWQTALGLGITLACTFCGIALSRIVREPNVLLPVALVAMPVDYIGAMTNIGFTQNVVERHPEIVRAVSVPVPTVGGLHPLGFIGPGDALFVAFFLAAVLRLGLNVRGTFWWMYGLLTVTLLFVLLTGVDVAALVPMGLSVLVANGGRMRLQRAEVFATLYAVALILALVVAFYVYSHAHFFRR